MKILPAHRLHIWKSTRHISVMTVAIGIVAILLVWIAVMVQADLSQMLASLLLSFWRIVVAYGISLGLAVVVGLAVTRNAKVEAALLPILDVLQSFPNFAILPITVTLFGAGSVSVIIILVITMVWPIMFGIIGGAKTLRSDLGEAAAIFGARGWKRIRAFFLPAIFPAVVTGSIVGWGEGWEAVVGVEIIARSSGIGGYINDVTNAGETRLLVLTLIILMYIIFVINNWVWLRLLRRTAQWGE